MRFFQEHQLEELLEVVRHHDRAVVLWPVWHRPLLDEADLRDVPSVVFFAFASQPSARHCIARTRQFLPSSSNMQSMPYVTPSGRGLRLRPATFASAASTISCVTVTGGGYFVSSGCPSGAQHLPHHIPKNSGQ